MLLILLDYCVVFFWGGSMLLIMLINCVVFFFRGVYVGHLVSLLCGGFFGDLCGSSC